MSETAFSFSCKGDRLVGILHEPRGTAASSLGLLIVVGGPQYRVGAHRQYLHLARHAATHGIPAMRFDYRGIGDSEGDYPGFEHTGPDIDAAIEAFRTRCPDLGGVVLWGMCEGASTILLNGVRNPFVKGAVLVNPWVRTESGEARTYLKHHYGKRLVSATTWRRLFSGDINIPDAIKSLFALLLKRFRPDAAGAAGLAFPDRMAIGLRDFSGEVLLLLSGRDLVAREFEDVSATATPWRGLLHRPSVHRTDIPDSDHTFSSEPWRQAAAAATIDFIRNIKRESI